MDMAKKTAKVKKKKDYFDFHFIFSKPNSIIQAFIDEADKDDRDMTAHFHRILEQRYLQE